MDLALILGIGGILLLVLLVHGQQDRRVRVAVKGLSPEQRRLLLEAIDAAGRAEGTVVMWRALREPVDGSRSHIAGPAWHPRGVRLPVGEIAMQVELLSPPLAVEPDTIDRLIVVITAFPVEP